jgi:predicted small secreted protein
MKKSILITAASAFLAATLLLTGCTTPAEKVENAKRDVTEAKKDLAEAEKAYLADIADYRNDAAVKITRNNDRIAAFTVSIESERKEAKADYTKKLAELEQENTDMKRRLDDYQASGKDNWESFKIEFSRDMDRLGKALSDLTDNNVR